MFSNTRNKVRGKDGEMGNLEYLNTQYIISFSSSWTDASMYRDI